MKVVAIMNLLPFVLAVLSLLCWIPAPATAGAKILAWLVILTSVIVGYTSLLVAGHLARRREGGAQPLAARRLGGMPGEAAAMAAVAAAKTARAAGGGEGGRGGCRAVRGARPRRGRRLIGFGVATIFGKNLEHAVRRGAPASEASAKCRPRVRGHWRRLESGFTCAARNVRAPVCGLLGSARAQGSSRQPRCWARPISRRSCSSRRSTRSRGHRRSFRRDPRRRAGHPAHAGAARRRARRAAARTRHLDHPGRERRRRARGHARTTRTTSTSTATSRRPTGPPITRPATTRARRRRASPRRRRWSS